MRVLRHLVLLVRSRWAETLNQVKDPYRPELYYMRGPGPRWHAVHRPEADAAAVAHSGADSAA